MSTKAEYLIKEPAFVGEEYTHATRENPEILRVDPGTEPSSKWIPLNAEAKADLKKLLDYRKKPQADKDAEAAKRLEEEHQKEAEEVKARHVASEEAGAEVKPEPRGSKGKPAPGASPI